jgi:NADH:ubiquinone oxidoreductase subunit 6 (subunit J)|tara:strand:- start:790 stop:915 length:126 start_codon:yes stop_codon:yes gene_type:complete
MNLYIPDFVIYVIAVLSMIIVLIMMSNLERKRIKEEKSKNV